MSCCGNSSKKHGGCGCTKGYGSKKNGCGGGYGCKRNGCCGRKPCKKFVPPAPLTPQ